MSQTGFLLKVLSLSVGLSLLIKSSGPVAVPETPVVVLTFVLVPSIIVAMALWWRSLPKQAD